MWKVGPGRPTGQLRATEGKARTLVCLQVRSSSDECGVAATQLSHFLCVEMYSAVVWRVNVWTSGRAEGIPNYVCEVARVDTYHVKVTDIRP